jgi:plastocyanin
MTNNASKFALGVAVAGVVAALGVALFLDEDKAQVILLVGLLLAAGAVALGVGRTVGADLPPRDVGNAATSFDPNDVPRGSYGPIILAIAAFLLVRGGAAGPDYVIAAVIVAVVAATVWLFDSFRTEVDVRDARNVDSRLLGPVALPTFAFLLTITIAYSLSRVLLAVSETASWVLAFIVAAVLFTILFVLAERRPSPKVVASLAAVGMVGVLVAGGAGAGVGEREFHPHTPEIASVEVLAKDIAFDRNVIGLPADEEVEMVFTNLDEGVFHNIGVYTAAEPGEPIFNGKPIAKGKTIYRFRAPDAGTYRYVCDFHPAMVGELRLSAATESESSSHEAKGHE